MGISKGAAYVLVVLFGFVLLFPSAAMQSAYSHPLATDVDKLDSIEAYGYFKKCDKVRVSAEVAEIMIHWDHTTQKKQISFNDGIDSVGLQNIQDGEVELLYKIWEPGHSKSPVIFGDTLYKTAKAVGSVVEPDWNINFNSIDEDYMKLNDTTGERIKPLDEQYFLQLKKAGGIKEIPSEIEKVSIFDKYGRAQYKTWMEDSHEKYVHVTCRENLNDLIVVISGFEVDNDDYKSKNEIEPLLGGVELENNINSLAKSQDDYKKWTTYSIAANAIEFIVGEKLEDVATTFLKDAYTAQLTKGEIKSFSNLVKKIGVPKQTQEALAKKFIGSVAGKGIKYVGRSVALFIEGPVGWAWFVYDTVTTIHDIYKIFSKEPKRQLLGIQIGAIPLNKFGQLEEAMFTVSTERTFKPFCVTKPDKPTPKVYNEKEKALFEKYGWTISEIPEPTAAMKKFNLKYPHFDNYWCKDMYANDPQYYLDFWEASGVIDEMAKDLQEHGGAPGAAIMDDMPQIDWDLLGANTPEKLADVYAKKYGYLSEWLKAKNIETKPYLSGTMSVTFKIQVESMNKCNTDDLPKTVTKPIKKTLFTVPKNVQQNSIQFLDYHTDDGHINAPITFVQSTQSSTPEWINQFSKLWVRSFEFIVEEHPESAIVPTSQPTEPEISSLDPELELISIGLFPKLPELESEEDEPIFSESTELPTPQNYSSGQLAVTNKTITYFPYGATYDESRTLRNALNPNQNYRVDVSWAIQGDDGVVPRGVAYAYVDSAIDEKRLERIGGSYTYVEGDRTISTPIIDGIATFRLETNHRAFIVSKNVDYYFNDHVFDGSVQLESIKAVAPHFNDQFIPDGCPGSTKIEQLPERVVTATATTKVNVISEYTTYYLINWDFTYPDGSKATASFKAIDQKTGNSIQLPFARCDYNYNLEITDVKITSDGYYGGGNAPISVNFPCVK